MNSSTACVIFILASFQVTCTGPYQWPIVGNLINVALANPTRPDLAMGKLAQKYGDVMSLKIGMHDAIVLSSYEVITDLTARDEFADRFQGFGFVTDRSFHQSLGIIWQNGPKYRKLLSFTHRTLRKYGYGKTSAMETFLEEELTDFISELNVKLEEGNKVLTITPDLFSMSFINILWCSVAGFRFSHSDEKLKRMIDLNDEVIKALSFDNVTMPYPFLRHWFPEWTGYNNQMRVFSELQDFMKELINQIRLAYENKVCKEPSNYIEQFLQEMKGADGDSDTIFVEEQLVMVMKDFFLAGSETTSNLLSYAILYLILYPEVQQRIQDELDQHLDSRHISLEDLAKLPYTEASLLEILRISNIGPIGPARATSADCKYKDYFVKKGTLVMVHFGAVSTDKTFWGDPEVFRPERFLNDDQTAVLPSMSSHVLAFGYGKRVCFGEGLARLSFFTYVTTFLRTYSIELPDKSIRASTIGVPNVTLKPYPFQARFIPRKTT